MDAREQLQTLHELEAQHDELLRELDALDERICQVLAECMTREGTEEETAEETLAEVVLEPEVAVVQ